MTSRKMRLRFWFVIGVANLLIFPLGCKSSGGAKNTPSSRPEVALSVGISAERVHSVAQDFFRNRGYVEAESRHRYEFVFDKPSKRARALRVRLRLTKQLDGSWQLVGSPLGVEAWRSDLESEIVLPQGASQIQAFLVEIKNRLQSGP